MSHTGNNHLERDLCDLAVVVLEDSETINQIVKWILKDLGVVDMRFVKTAEDALAAFRTRPPHLVLAELREGWEDGLLFLKEVRKSQREAANTTHFIMLIPYPHQDVILRARGAGADAVVAEPLSEQELAEHIRGVTDH